MLLKVTELNLEYGSPTADAALMKLKNALVTAKGQGIKAVIVIHGYGSTGTGGKIKTAVRKVLTDSSLSGVVRAFCGGEDWYFKKRELLTLCKSLEDFDRRISGNNGVTVVLLK